MADLEEMRLNLKGYARENNLIMALRRIREVGYNSSAARCTDTVLSCIRIAEEALTENSREPDTCKHDRLFCEICDIDFIAEIKASRLVGHERACSCSRCAQVRRGIKRETREDAG